MALFKILKGPKANLGAPTSISRYTHEGYAYFTPEDGKFYIDIAGDGSTTLAKGSSDRVVLNAEKATRDDLGNEIHTTYVTVDTQNANQGNINLINADTLGGLPVTSFALKSDLELLDPEGESIDLSNYVTLDVLQANYVQNSTLNNYASKEYLNNYVQNSVLDNYVQEATLSSYVLKTDLNNYATTNSLSSYALKTELNNYAKTSSLNSYALKTDLSGYATTSSLSSYALKTDLNNYTKTSVLTSTYATKNELANYVKISEINNYITSAIGVEF